MREPTSASADFLSADFPLIPRLSRRPRACKTCSIIYTIIFLALAVFIFLRLRSVLGQRTGRERPPYDPYAPRDAVRGRPTTTWYAAWPGRRRRAKPAESAEPIERWKGIAEAGSTSPTGLDAIVRERQDLRRQAFRHRRACRLRDDRSLMPRATAAPSRTCCPATSMRGSRPPSVSARRRARPSRPASCRSTSPT